MKRKTADDYPQELLDLFHEYQHGDIDRRSFLSGAAKFAVGGLTVAAILESLKPNYAWAQTVAKDDKDLKTGYETVPSPQGNGSIKGYLARPAVGKKFPAVLVIHENRGLNPYIEDVARRLAKAGYVAFAPDGLTSVGGYPGDDEKGAAAFRNVDGMKMTEDFVAAALWLKARKDSSGKLGAVGFCFGGGMVNQLAVRLGKDLDAGVAFYGRQAGVSDVLKISAPLMFHYAGSDERVNAGIAAYEAALKENNKKYESFIYEGKQHGFHNDTTPRYDAEAAKSAWERTLAFFRENLGTTESNPLLAGWKGNYGGVPPFDKVQVAHFKPALEAAMAENLSEIDSIANNSAAPTFENTIAEMERAGSTLERVSTVYNIWNGTMSTPEMRGVEREMGPKLAAFSDKITQNEKLFRRIEAVYDSREKSNLTPEQKRLTWRYYTNFVRAGAKLGATEKKRLSEINQELAGLYTRFSQNLLADETDLFIAINDEAQLAGLPQSLRDAAAQTAAAKNLKGAWVISNTRSSVDPFLTYSDRRDLREKVWKMFVNRGDNADKNDNNAIISEILQLRAGRAKLLGFPTHAHWRLDNVMAKTPERAMELMEAVWKPAVARVAEEVADMQALADKEAAKITIEPWDYRYYAEKVRKERYDLDQNEVKQYLQLEKLREGMFWVAGELFNFSFTPVTDVPVYHPDVRVWEVKDKTSGKHVGLWYFDPYARTGKRSGAWMNSYRTQERMDKEITTIVSNNSNFVKGAPGAPVLISWDDATTLFHEFGHALHGLSSNVIYPSLSGTSVARDYVEFPSQLLEHWLSTPEVLQKFALHHETGKPIPQSLVDKIKKADTFNQGFDTVEYLASALIDMKLHLAGSQKIDADTFERETLAQLGMPRQIVMRHRTPQFGHVFSSDGYSAGYYSYLWSDVLTADAYGAFTEGKGAYDKEVGRRLIKNVFSVGNTIDPAEGYRNFRGRDPQIEALMKKRGFPVSNTKNSPNTKPQVKPNR